MSSQPKSASIDWQSTGAHELRNRIHEIEPLFALDADEEWTLMESPLADGMDCRLVQDMVQAGAVEVVGEQAPGDRDDADDDDHGGYRNLYQWDATARDVLKQYRETMPTLPCGCRSHVPSGGAYPDPWMRCKHCGAAHRKAVVRESL